MKVLSLIQTENKICNKIITTIAALCCECKLLVHECERKYLPAILFFGEGGEKEFQQSSRANLLLIDQDAKEQQQSYMAQFIALLQVCRCVPKPFWLIVFVLHLGSLVLCQSVQRSGDEHHPATFGSLHSARRSERTVRQAIL